MLLPQHRLPADEFHSLEGDGEADTGLEGIDLVGELIPAKISPASIRSGMSRAHDAPGLAG